MPLIDQKTAHLQEELEKYRDQVRKLQSDLHISKETQLEQLQEELKSCTQRANDTILTLAMEKTQLAQQNKRLEEAVDGLAQEVIESKSQYEKIKELEAENTRLTKLVYNLEQEISILNIEKLEIQSQNTDLLNAYKSLRSKVITYATQDF